MGQQFPTLTRYSVSSNLLLNCKTRQGSSAYAVWTTVLVIERAAGLVVGAVLVKRDEGDKDEALRET